MFIIICYQNSISELNQKRSIHIDLNLTASTQLLRKILNILIIYCF